MNQKATSMPAVSARSRLISGARQSSNAGWDSRTSAKAFDGKTARRTTADRYLRTYMRRFLPTRTRSDRANGGRRPPLRAQCQRRYDAHVAEGGMRLLDRGMRGGFLEA